MDAAPTPSSGPKKPFWIVVALLVIGFIGFAVYRADIVAPGGEGEKTGKISKEDLAKAAGAEAPDASAPTTVKEYTFVPESTLPPVKGVSGYKAMKDNTLRFALNVWAGWAPIIYANNGFKAGKEWVTPDGKKKFKVELVLIDDPVAMRDAYASGNVHIGWATLDMLPLFMDELSKDSRVMPRVYQQIDWSNGGDGIVARGGVQNVGQLRGKTIVLAQNSPSQYFVLNSLINAGVQPSDVTFKYTQDAFQAAAAFNADKSITACVSWAPDIYNLAKASGNKLIVSTQTANHLIADVWFARADFAKDEPQIIEALVRGIFDAGVALKEDANKQTVSRLMAEGYNLPAADAMNMLGDAHWTNFAENREFFLNQNNPANFETTWETAYYLYKRIGKVQNKVPFNQVMDFSVIKKLINDPKYANQKNEYLVDFAAKNVGEIKAESGEILTKTVIIHFFPNSSDTLYKLTKKENGKEKEVLYDPSVPFVLEEIGRLAAQFGASRIVIEGNTDASMKGRIPFDAVRQLSQDRAESVKKSLLGKYKNFNPNQFSVVGNGWNTPADPNDPDNHAKNRRVEIKVYPLEAQ